MTSSGEELEKIIRYFNIVTVSFCLLLESSCLILFVFHFFKRTPAFCSNYFYLLFVGYVIAIIAVLFSLLELVTDYESILSYMNLISECYFNLFLGPWNTVLAINRSTALLLWQQHSTIWSGWRFKATIAIVLIYPAIGTGIITSLGAYCFSTDDDCEDIFDQYDGYKVVSNAINIGISATLGIATVLLLRYKVIQISTDTKNMENHLLIQSIVSTVVFGVYCIYGFIVDIFYDETEQKQLMNSILYSILFAISKFYLLYYHMSSTLLLFCLSDTVRKSFIQFYSCKQMKSKKHPLKTRVTAMKTTTALT